MSPWTEAVQALSTKVETGVTKGHFESSLASLSSKILSPLTTIEETGLTQEAFEKSLQPLNNRVNTLPCKNDIEQWLTAREERAKQAMESQTSETMGRLASWKQELAVEFAEKLLPLTERLNAGRSEVMVLRREKEALEENAREVQTLSQELGQREGELKSVNEQNAKLEHRTKELLSMHHIEKAHASTMSCQSDELKAKLQACEAGQQELIEIRALLQHARETQSRAESNFNEATEARIRMHQKNKDLEQRISELQQALQAANAQSDARLREQTSAMTEKVTKANRDLEKSREKEKRLIEAEKTSQESLAQATTKYNAVETELEQTRQNAADLEEELNNVKANIEQSTTDLTRRIRDTVP
ncbi:hypothetical protein NW752_006908 [Fusarium irregulare]|uniref:Uncharacterized protein n=1 Tax=Fusarium irregulare TaxID=2494466 RepID=A0A9W8PSR1_9HYPO|nr:hypothetical protein NW766_005788 [Fusarium irregulare]KAJ4015975.1 hypothetical protein NW752_006908 [Fusarium irregulare]